MKRLYVWTLYANYMYYKSQEGSLIPNPHSSGDWIDGFEFNNINWLQLAVL